MEQQHSDLHESICWLGRLLMIDREYQAGAASPILAELARIMKEIGLEAFITAWQEVFPGQPPPLEAIGQALVGLATENGRE